MSLFVDLNSQFNFRILQDLQFICGDPYVTIDSTNGKLSVPAHGGDTTEACLLLATIAGSNYNVRIRAEAPPFSIAPTAGSTLAEVFGYTWTSARGPQASSDIEIVYDGTNCGGVGMWAVGALESGGGTVPLPTHVMLFHELVHAVRAGEGWDTGNPSLEEEAARDAENAYRAALGIKRRSRVDGLVGCNPPPEPTTQNPMTTKSGGGYTCFVATAAYGSPLAPEVEFLRRFRDDVLRRTPTGSTFFDRFYEHYNRVSPMVAAAMHREPELMDVMRSAIVTPIVRYLELVMRFPTAPLTDVPEPWRSFLLTCRDQLEEWALAFPLPETLAALPAPVAVEEIGITLRYRLRADRSRSEYLQRLAADKQIPLPSGEWPAGALRARLVAYGLAPHEVDSVLGVADQLADSKDGPVARDGGQS
jgi:hypothetical protein